MNAERDLSKMRWRLICYGIVVESATIGNHGISGSEVHLCKFVCGTHVWLLRSLRHDWIECARHRLLGLPPATPQPGNRSRFWTSLCGNLCKVPCENDLNEPSRDGFEAAMLIGDNFACQEAWIKVLCWRLCWCCPVLSTISLPCHPSSQRTIFIISIVHLRTVQSISAPCSNRNHSFTDHCLFPFTSEWHCDFLDSRLFLITCPPYACSA